MLKEVVVDEAVIMYLSTLVDNTIELRMKEADGVIKREVAVIKARMSEASSRVLEMKLENG
jgi:KaiC/GvpD/RAD55 family RecA-like ATPase|uniref:Uncharacterized protein n=1 Tax=Thermofilum pendens TaxID=2269 RepID=A0A7C4BA58_THEPE